MLLFSCDVVNINLADKPGWYQQKINPLGQTPSISWGNHFTAFDSLIVADYLNEKFPSEHNLSAPTLERKAADSAIVALYMDKVVKHVYALMYGKKDEEEALKNEAALLNGLRILENKLVERQTPFFNGKTVGLVDYNIWPWFERMQLLEMDLRKVNFHWKGNFPALVKISLRLNHQFDDAFRTIGQA